MQTSASVQIKLVQSPSVALKNFVKQPPMPHVRRSASLQDFFRDASSVFTANNSQARPGQSSTQKQIDASVVQLQSYPNLRRAGMLVAERLKVDNRTRLISHIGSATAVIRKSQNNTVEVSNVKGDPTHGFLLRSTVQTLRNDPFLLSELEQLAAHSATIRVVTLPELLDGDAIFMKTNGVTITGQTVNIRIALKDQFLSSAPKFPHARLRREGMILDANPVAFKADFKVGPIHFGAMWSPWGASSSGFAYDLYLRDKKLGNARDRIAMRKLESQAAKTSDTMIGFSE